MPLSSLVQGRSDLSRTQLLRRLTQLGFALFIIVSSVRHHVVTSQHLASIDAYCPFGGFATLYRWLSSGGLFVQKTHQSNMVLALGLICQPTHVLSGSTQAPLATSRLTLSALTA